MVILIETMRREGFELSVGRPQVIYKKKDGQTLEPIEHLFIDCDESFVGIISEKLSKKKRKNDKSCKSRNRPCENGIYNSFTFAYRIQK